MGRRSVSASHLRANPSNAAIAEARTAEAKTELAIIVRALARQAAHDAILAARIEAVSENADDE